MRVWTTSKKRYLKTLSWHWPPLSSLPHFVSDLSLAPLLISQGIKVTLPLFSCRQRIAVAYGHFIPSVNSAQKRRCSHDNVDLSDWAIFHRANSRWGRLLPLQHMSNLPARSLNLISAIFRVYFDALCMCVPFIIIFVCVLVLDSFVESSSQSHSVKCQGVVTLCSAG